MSTIRKLFKGSFLRTVDFSLQVLVSFFMIPIIIHSLGDRMYGIWFLVGSFMGYYGLLDLGLSTAVSRFISRAIGGDDEKDVNRILSTTFGLFLLLGILVFIIALVLVVFSDHFVTDQKELTAIRLVLLILGINMAIDFPFRAFNGLLNSYLRYDYLTYASVVRLALANGFILESLKMGYGIVSMAFINLAAFMVQRAMLFAYSKTVFTQMKIRPAFFDTGLVKHLFSYSYKSFIAQLADILRFRVDGLVIAAFLNVQLVTYYAVGQKLVDYFGGLILRVTGIMMPLFSQYEARNDFETIRKRFLQVTRVTVILSIFVGTSIIFYGNVFIQKWMGAEFHDSYVILVILTVPMIIALMQSPGVSLLFGISKHHYYAVINTMEGVTNLVLSILLVGKYGFFGVAYATAIEMIFFKLFVQPFIICRSIELPVHQFYLGGILSPSVKMLLPLSLFFYFAKGFLKPDYFTLMSLGIIQVLVVTPFLYFFVLDPETRYDIRRAINFDGFKGKLNLAVGRFISLIRRN